MPITTNRYKVTPIHQMIDLNGDAKNFRIKFTCRAQNESTPFEVLVMTQAQLDNPESKNLNFKKVNGSITGEINADKNMYQNYILLIRAPEDTEIEVVSDFQRLPDNIQPPPQRPSQPQSQSQSQHQHSHPHQQPSNTKSSGLTNQSSKKSFLNSSTFLWIVVGIIGLFLIYFIFFYNSGNKNPIKIENNKATALESLPPIMHPSFAPPLKKTAKKKKKKKHNFDDF